MSEPLLFSEKNEVTISRFFLQEPEPTSLEDAMKESVSTYASSSSKSYEMLKLESLPTSGEHRIKVEKI